MEVELKSHRYVCVCTNSVFVPTVCLYTDIIFLCDFRNKIKTRTWIQRFVFLGGLVCKGAEALNINNVTWV